MPSPRRSLFRCRDRRLSPDRRQALGQLPAGAVELVDPSGTARRGEPLPVWTGVLAVGLGAAVLQPWIGGSIVIAVSFVVVCVAKASAWVTRLSTRRLPALAAVVVSVGTATTLLVPEVAATLPHAHERVSHGEVAALDQVCRAFGPAHVALMVDQQAADEWLTAVRATCVVPSQGLAGLRRLGSPARQLASCCYAPPGSGAEVRGNFCTNALTTAPDSWPHSSR